MLPRALLIVVRRLLLGNTRGRDSIPGLARSLVPHGTFCFKSAPFLINRLSMKFPFSVFLSCIARKLAISQISIPAGSCQERVDRFTRPGQLRQ